jgi:hypothetical protein
VAPEPAAAGQAVLYGGYPQILRNQRAAKLTLVFQHFMTKVSSVDPDRIIWIPASRYFIGLATMMNLLTSNGQE